jgi:hypothetical protein
MSNREITVVAGCIRPSSIEARESQGKFPLQVRTDALILQDDFRSTPGKQTSSEPLCAPAPPEDRSRPRAPAIRADRNRHRISPEGAGLGPHPEEPLDKAIG